VIDSLSPDDCDKFLAFCAEPRIPSLEKFASLRAVGVLRGFGECRLPLPLVISVSCGVGTSMENLSLEMENCPDLPETEVGEASGELDIVVRQI